MAVYKNIEIQAYIYIHRKHTYFHIQKMYITTIYIYTYIYMSYSYIGRCEEHHWEMALALLELLDEWQLSPEAWTQKKNCL